VPLGLPYAPVRVVQSQHQAPRRNERGDRKLTGSARSRYHLQIQNRSERQVERKKGQRRSAQAGSTAERRRTVDSSRYSSPRGSSCHCDAYDVCGSRRPPRESKTLQRRQSPPRKVRENVLSYIAQDAHCPRLFKKSRAFSLWAEFFISEPAPFPPRKTGTFKTRRLLKNPRVPRCCQFCEDCKEPSAGLMGLRGPHLPASRGATDTLGDTARAED